jgi:hypothetical protein
MIRLMVLMCLDGMVLLLRQQWYLNNRLRSVFN